ncbi:uncharacterized protein LOC143018458 [Oratosquilla oratoria]|uniref:uncharacterized protein LOC143018458 n=1 Tax=Oratosquilla oratoria TaxID=337810 RepID=UPI003F762DA2
MPPITGKRHKIYAAVTLGFGTVLLLTSYYDVLYTKLLIKASRPLVECPKDGFLVHSPKCFIPDLEPQHPSALRFLGRIDKVTCTLVPPLTTSRGTTLLFHEDQVNNTLTPNLQNFVKAKQGNDTTGRADGLYCCYHAIWRLSQPKHNFDKHCDDNYVLYNKCVPITQAETTITQEAILVICKVRKFQVYTNIHIFVQRDKILRRKEEAYKRALIKAALGTKGSSLEDESRNFSTSLSLNGVVLGQAQSRNDSADRENRTKSTSLQDRLSVIIFMTTAVSRLHFHRTMPKTLDFLTKELGALEFKGYNQVGDSTYPNVISFLMGFSHKEIRSHPCFAEKIRVLDDCPFVWNEFKENGYVTAFMEDTPNVGIFNSKLSGFRAQPTEFYGRSFLRAMNRGVSWQVVGNLNFCQGPRMSLQVVQEASLDMAKAFPDIPHFGFFVSRSVTQDYLSVTQNADGPHFEYLKELRASGALNRSVLVFLSDYGRNLGEVRSAWAGRLEERLPFMFFVLPSWFQQSYPEAFSNLMGNTHSLTSNFDLHKTLQDLAHGRYALKSHVRSVPGDTRGVSLFQQIPEDRSCRDAGIKEKFCSCHTLQDLALNDPIALNGSDFVMATINRNVQKFKQCIKCTKYDLLRADTIQAHIKMKPFDSLSQDRVYMLQLRLSPGEDEVQASLLYYPLTGQFVLAGDINHINTHKHSGESTANNTFQKSCFCN